uniref:Sjoegren syndrome/scleroderma autoantigen 1 n=1 Tax=Gallus gallus TaxID=9031 RepID=A0A8V0X0C7_CHICK
MALNAGTDPDLGGGAAEEERRERQERISRALGQYLLRGYRMLGSCCPQCQTILLQDRQQQLYCVTCQELEGDKGYGMGLTPCPPLSTAPQPPPCHPDAPRPKHCEGAAAAAGHPPPPPPPSPPRPPSPPPPTPYHIPAAVAAAEAAVLGKLRWAAQELPPHPTAEGSAQLCVLIRSCAEALRALRGLGVTPPTPTPQTGTPPPAP